MIFSSKNAFAEIIHQPKISAEEKLLSLVHQTWENFNHFLDSNLRMLIVFMKDMSQMRDRQKEQVQTLLQNIKGARSRSGSEDNSDEGPNIVKSNGMIFHDFNYPEYVNSLFAEEEVIKKDFVLMATEPEAQKSVKVVENPVTEKTLTPYQIDMRKMKTVVKKAESHAKENVSGAAEFRAQFTDFLKNVNQSYALLKGSIIEDKTKKDEKADKTTVADETGQSSINLFQKMKVKKKYMITEIKPKAKPEPRVVSAVLNDAQKPLISKRRLSAVRHNKKYTESSLRYEDSDSGMKDKIMNNFGKSMSQGRRRSRELMDSLNQTRESSLKFRARRQRVTDSDYSPSEYEIRKPKDFSSILFSEKFNSSSILRSRFY